MSADILEGVLNDLDIDYYKEYKFHSSRKFRFDFFLPISSEIIKGIGIEYDGALWVRGRHQTPKGFFNDTVKTNLALSSGFLVLRYTSEHLKNYESLELVKNEIKKTIKLYSKSIA